MIHLSNSGFYPYKSPSIPWVKAMLPGFPPLPLGLVILMWGEQAIPEWYSIGSFNYCPRFWEVSSVGCAHTIPPRTQFQAAVLSPLFLVNPENLFCTGSLMRVPITGYSASLNKAYGILIHADEPFKPLKISLAWRLRIATPETV